MRVYTHRYDVEQGEWQPPLPDIGPTGALVLGFGAPDAASHAAPFDALRARFPDAVFAGCSTAGEILGAHVHDRSLVVAVLDFDATRLRRAEAEADAPAALVGAKLARTLRAPDLTGVLLISDGLAVNGSALCQGLDGTLGGRVTICGGLAADGERFERTWVLDADARPRSGRVTAVGLYGDRVRVGHGSDGGWSIFGPERRITRAEGNVLHTLDGQPALALYKRYLGEHAEDLPATGLLFPLRVRAPAVELPVVRTVLAVDEATQTMTFAGDLPEGGTAQLMRTNLDQLVDGAERAARQARDGCVPANDTFALAVSCVGRRMVMADLCEEEVEATLEGLPKGTEQLGFYSYGEITPQGGRCTLHNQTMTLMTLQEVG